MTEAISNLGYIKLPEYGFANDQRAITALSIREKSRKLLEEDQSLEGAISTFTVEASFPSSQSIALLLPGIVHAPQTVFEHQISTLSGLGHDVIGINYSDSAYSQELLKAQIADFIKNPINQDKAITLIGVSLGACIIIDLLGNANTDELKNVKNAIMLGTIYSVADLKNGPFGKLLRFANKTTPKPVAERFASLARMLFRVDRLYAGKDDSRSEELKAELHNVSGQALVARTKAIGNTRAIEELGRIDDVSVLLGWWEDDYASPEARQKLKNLFPRKEEFLIDGHHGWTSSNASQINAAISRFFSHQNA